MTISNRFTAGDAVLFDWLGQIDSPPPTRWAIPAPFAAFDLRPGRLILLGGAPGSGKTAAVMQMVVDALIANESLRVLVANVEMAPLALIERVLSRFSGVDLTAIADRAMTPEQADRVRTCAAPLAPILTRLAFLEGAPALEAVAAAATAFSAELIVLDYVQRFSLGGSEPKTQRESIDGMMGVLRKFCIAGAGVLAVASVGRQRSNTGSNYANLGLASFRGSSELEFGADSAWLAAPNDAGNVLFSCVKNRFGQLIDVFTRFDASIQSFSVPPEGFGAFDESPAATNRKGR